MRTGTITLNGQQHILCFSVRVVRNCTERYGSMKGLHEALSSESELQVLDESLWLLRELMEAGAKYAALHDLETVKPLTADELQDTCDLNEIGGIKTAILLTLKNGKKRNVEVEGSPNAEATQGN